MADPAANERRRPCPRCDYDLSGVADSWADQCPLEGRCPECGLTYRWGHILNPNFTTPHWSFEHTRRRHVRCWLSSNVRTLRPDRFWRALRMGHPIIRRRLFWVPVLVPLLLYLTLGAVNLAYSLKPAGLGQAQFTQTEWRQLQNGVRRALSPQLTRRFFSIRENVPRRTTPPFTVTIPSGTFRIDLSGQPAITRVWTWQHAARSFFWPFGPSSILESISFPTYWIILTLLWALLTPLSYLAVRDTLRSCRVRGAHFERIVIYSSSWIGTLVIFQLLPIALFQPTGYFDPTKLRIQGWVHFIWSKQMVVVISAAFLFLWWYRATRDYLRLPHATSVAAAMVIMGILGGMVVLSYWPGSDFMWELGTVFQDVLAW